MRFFRAVTKPRRTLLKRSYKGAAFFYVHKIVVHNFEALTVGSNTHKAKCIKKMHATCRIYELDSCNPVSRPTMNYSVMSLPKAQALCPPPPSRKLRGVSGFLHPHDELADSLRL